MKRSLFVGLLAVTLLLGGLAFARNANQTGTQNVSLIQLIANPDKFDGHRVRLIGFVRIEFEGNAVYLHEDDDKYAVIEGVFSSKHHGQMGLFSGSLEQSTRFDQWAEVTGWTPHGVITSFK